MKDFTISWQGSQLQDVGWNGYVNKCENLVRDSDISVCTTVMVSTESSATVLQQDPFFLPFGNCPSMTHPEGKHQVRVSQRLPVSSRTAKMLA